MSLLDNYCKLHFNCISISKIAVKSLGALPEIKKLAFFFIVDTKQYKKNVLLFYILISLFFGGSLVIRKKELQGFLVLKTTLRQRKGYLFLLGFINFYLPTLSTVANTVKTGLLVSTAMNKKILVYRLAYFTFPLIPQLDLLFAKSERIQHFIASYRFQIDFYLPNIVTSKDSGEFLLRLLRLPCVIKLNKLVL